MEVHRVSLCHHVFESLMHAHAQVFEKVLTASKKPSKKRARQSGGAEALDDERVDEQQAYQEKLTRWVKKRSVR